MSSFFSPVSSLTPLYFPITLELLFFFFSSIKIKPLCNFQCFPSVFSTPCLTSLQFSQTLGPGMSTLFSLLPFPYSSILFFPPSSLCAFEIPIFCLNHLFISPYCCHLLSNLVVHASLFIEYWQLAYSTLLQLQFLMIVAYLCISVRKH